MHVHCLLAIVGVREASRSVQKVCASFPAPGVRVVSHGGSTEEHDDKDNNLLENSCELRYG